MSDKKGLLQSCDRCGATCFREYVGKGSADGGFTTWDQFEPAPEGWDFHGEVGRLCPACNAEYEAMIDAFKGAKEDAD